MKFRLCIKVEIVLITVSTMVFRLQKYAHMYIKFYITYLFIHTVSTFTF